MKYLCLILILLTGQSLTYAQALPIDLDPVIIHQKSGSGFKNYSRLHNELYVFTNAPGIKVFNAFTQLSYISGRSDGKTVTKIISPVSRFDTTEYSVTFIIYQIISTDTFYKEIPVRSAMIKNGRITYDCFTDSISLHNAPFYLGYRWQPRKAGIRMRLKKANRGNAILLLRINGANVLAPQKELKPYPFEII